MTSKEFYAWLNISNGLLLLRNHCYRDKIRIFVRVRAKLRELQALRQISKNSYLPLSAAPHEINLLNQVFLQV